MRQHSHTIACIQGDKLTSYLVRDYFQLSRYDHLMWAMLTNKLGQVDLVMCLLRLRDTAVGDHRRILSEYIKSLVGKPIAIGVPCLLHYRMPAHTVREPRVVWVAKANPRQTNTQAFLRWPEFKVGRTEAQLRQRGITRRDIRRATKQGWVKMAVANG